MPEFFATIIIIVSSALLLAYWFRYTCLLILSAKTARDYAGEVAMANQLSFPEVQSRLRETASADLDRLRDLLNRDYAVLSYLLKYAANPSARGASLETAMLAVNYRVMGAWYRVSRKFSDSAACGALEEMSQVVAHFANAMGARAAAAA